MGILELSTILITLAAVFTLINIRLLKLPQTIGLMILALVQLPWNCLKGALIPSINLIVQMAVTRFVFLQPQMELMGVVLNTRLELQQAELPAPQERLPELQ